MQLSEAFRVARADGGVNINGQPLERFHGSSSRDCFVYNGLMVKLEGACYRGQVLAEVLLWPSIEEEDLDFFVPLVGAGFTDEGEVWLAQELIVQSGAPKTKDADRYAEHLLNKVMRKYGIWDVYPGCPSLNWSWVDGFPRIFDWGMNPLWRETSDEHANGDRIPTFEWAIS